MNLMDNIYKRIIFKRLKDKDGNVICPIKTPNGKIFFSLSERMNDPLSLSIKSGSSYLLQEALTALNFADSGKTFIDIGANIGIWSFVFADAGYKVIGFEASKENYDSLIRSAFCNGYDCIFENVAVTPKSGGYTFISNGPYGHLVNAFDTESGDIVKGVSIDDYFSDKDIKNGVGLIKIDIEGGEIGALSGMDKFLADNGYPPCFVESNGHCLF